MIPKDIPPEIHDIIVGLLDAASIKALALSCRGSLPACRAHLFSTLELTPQYIRGQDCKVELENFHRKAENLKRVFDANPSLAHLVRHLTCMFLRCDGDAREIRSVLGTMTRVRSLTVRGAHRDSTVYRTSVDWSSLSPGLHQALTRIVQLPSLTQLCLDQVTNFPLTVLVSSPNLSHLTIESADFEEGSVSGSNAALIRSTQSPTGGREEPPTLRLKSLTFTDYSSRAIMSLMKAEDKSGRPTVDLSHLVTLESLDKTGEMVVPTLLQTSHHLESLSCTVWDTFNNPFRDLLKPHTLKTLKIFRPIIVIPPWLGDLPIDPYYSLPSEFEKWAEHNILEQVEITINVEQNAKIPTTPDSWCALNTLAVQNHFPGLRTVVLRINLQEETAWAKQVKNTLESQQREIFRDLYQKDKLDFQLIIGLP